MQQLISNGLSSATGGEIFSNDLFQTHTKLKHLVRVVTRTVFISFRTTVLLLQSHTSSIGSRCDIQLISKPFKHLSSC